MVGLINTNRVGDLIRESEEFINAISYPTVMTPFRFLSSTLNILHLAISNTLILHLQTATLPRNCSVLEPDAVLPFSWGGLVTTIALPEGKQRPGCRIIILRNYQRPFKFHGILARYD